MRPRILLRTHYQADEPRTIIVTTTDCASPTVGRREDSITKALVAWARAHEYIMSLPAAVYALDNARMIGLLDKSNRWTAGGLAFGYIRSALGGGVRSDARQLSLPEQRLYLKYYVVNAGALLIKFGEWLIAHERVTDSELRTESVIERLVVSALDDYLGIATDIRDRTAIRHERDRLSKTHYAASTKRHKRYPLLTTMKRLRLLELLTDNSGHETIVPDSGGRLASLLDAIPDVRSLEQLSREETLQPLLSLIAQRWPISPELRYLQGGELLANAYTYGMDRGLHACPLEYLDDVLFALPHAGLSGRETTYQAADLLQFAHKERPTDIRFHVDRRGRRAYVLMNKRVLEDLPEILSPWDR
jgi:hypothetical protein